MSDLAVAAFAAIDPLTVTSELAAPALQRGEPHAQQQSQFAVTGTVSDAFIQDLQGLLAIVIRRQSSPSYPQKAWIFFAAMSSDAASVRVFSL